MAVLNYLLKSKRSMSKLLTKPVKVRHFNVTSHAQNRIVQKTRKLKKLDLVDNLYRKPLARTKSTKREKGYSYDRIGRHCTASINPYNNNKTTVRRPSKKEVKKYNLIRKGKSRKYVNKSK